MCREMSEESHYGPAMLHYSPALHQRTQRVPMSPHTSLPHHTHSEDSISMDIFAAVPLSLRSRKADPKLHTSLYPRRRQVWTSLPLWSHVKRCLLRPVEGAEVAARSGVVMGVPIENTRAVFCTGQVHNITEALVFQKWTNVAKNSMA